jgi:predicted NBD/HSP70 family sugar kinase
MPVDVKEAGRFLLIGIDGGATKVSGWSLEIVDNGKAFTLGSINCVKSYHEYAGFIENFLPVDLNQQLSEWERGEINLTQAERQQANCYLAAVVEVISKIIRESGRQEVLVGIGMPGIKTADKRGIAVLKNGPRIIDYADQIERRLLERGVKLIAPIAEIGSDAYYCGIGEEYATEGYFRGVNNSYYLGGGTGAADALKLNGKVIPLDETKGWFVKSWELSDGEGHSIERYVSSRGIQLIYGDLVGKSLDELNQAGIFPPQIYQLARQGDPAASQTFQQVIFYLAKLLYERITSLYAGWQNLFTFVNPNRPQPANSHSYRQILFDSLIIGQRLGDLLKDAQEDDILWSPLIGHLTQLVSESPFLDQRAKDYYCPNGQFDRSLIKISRLREAPALGAGIDAYLTWRG